MQKLQLFLTSNPLIKTFLPSVEELVSLLENKKANGEIVTLFYGETFDEFGMTIDSLKYYFVLSLLHYHLDSEGYKVRSVVIQADAASVLNKSTQGKKHQLSEQLTSRLELLNKIIATYNLPIQVELMSNIFQTDAYQGNLRLVNEFAQTQAKDSEFYTNIKNTVLRNRLKQEQETDFQYAREAIATSMLFDVKLGPPREQFYDKAQHLLTKHTKSKAITAIYLTPSYPLNQNFAFFLSNPEIEEFGITPYKAGSNKLQDSRIVLGETDSDRARELITNSFESPNPETVHPVLDMLLIGDVAKRLLAKETSFPTYSIDELLKDEQSLKTITTKNIQKYVLEKI